MNQARYVLGWTAKSIFSLDRAHVWFLRRKTYVILELAGSGSINLELDSVKDRLHCNYYLGFYLMFLFQYALLFKKINSNFEFSAVDVG